MAARAFHADLRKAVAHYLECLDPDGSEPDPTEQRSFTLVKHAKPPASRKGSSEWYVVAQGFKG